MNEPMGSEDFDSKDLQGDFGLHQGMPTKCGNPTPMKVFNCFLSDAYIPSLEFTTFGINLAEWGVRGSPREPEWREDPEGSRGSVL